MSVLLETTMGDIVIDLYTEHRPRCCVNFLKLCKVKYYNYSTIFNVQRDFVVQCGDPTDKGKTEKFGATISPDLKEIRKTGLQSSSVQMARLHGFLKPKNFQLLSMIRSVLSQ